MTDSRGGFVFVEQAAEEVAPLETATDERSL
jgi:hypothetical protein